MDEDQVDIDPLFIGMTRPALVKGVPMEFFGINFIIFGIGMIGFTSLSAKFAFVLLVCVPLHILAYIATEREPHWMNVRRQSILDTAHKNIRCASGSLV